MRRLLQTKIEDVLAVKIIEKEFTAGSTAFVDCDNEEICININRTGTFENTNEKRSENMELNFILK